MSQGVDEHLAKRLRQTRKAAGLTLSDVAKGLGISPQQVQKYETAINKLAAARVYEAARFFNISVLSFYEGLPSADGSYMDAGLSARAARDQQLKRLVQLFDLAPPSARSRIVSLMEVIAAGEPGEQSSSLRQSRRLRQGDPNLRIGGAPSCIFAEG